MGGGDLEVRGDGELELAGVRVVGIDVLGVLGRERARQGGESETGLLLVLRRSQVGELRLCSELSTWSSAAELVGVAWRGEEGSSARGSGSRRSLGCCVGR